MRTFTHRLGWLAMLLPAACAWMSGACRSGPDLLSTGGAGVIGVPIDVAGSSNVSLASVFLSKGVVFGASSNGNNGGDSPRLLRIAFEPPGATDIFPRSQTGNRPPEIAMAGDGLAWIQCSGGPDCRYVVANPATDASAASNLSRPNATLGAPSAMVADDDALYVALLDDTGSLNGAGSPDEPTWPDMTTVDVKAYPGDLVRIARADGGSQSARVGSAGGGFAFGYVRHLIAQDARNVYTVTADSAQQRVVRLGKSSWAAGPSTVASVANGTSQAIVGLAAVGDTVAWAVVPALVPGSTGCEIGAIQTDGDGGAAAPARSILQASTYTCWGLALDATHAYFTVVGLQTASSGSSGQEHSVTFLVGTRIGRVPLAGGSAEFIDVGGTQYYGPRRVLVDDAFVYGIDPRVVLRVRKDVAWSK